MAGEAGRYLDDYYGPDTVSTADVLGQYPPSIPRPPVYGTPKQQAARAQVTPDWGTGSPTMQGYYEYRARDAKPPTDEAKLSAPMLAMRHLLAAAGEMPGASGVGFVPGPMGGGMVSGMFGGMGARSMRGNPALQARAEAIQAKGAPRQDILGETGLFMAPDNKWRFEFPHHEAKWRGPTSPQETFGPLGEYLDFPRLYHEYPGSQNIPTTTNPEMSSSGFYWPQRRGENIGSIGIGMLGGSKHPLGPLGDIMARGRMTLAQEEALFADALKNPRSATNAELTDRVLHESQHGGVQYPERHAAGSSSANESTLQPSHWETPELKALRQEWDHMLQLMRARYGSNPANVPATEPLREAAQRLGDAWAEGIRFRKYESSWGEKEAFKNPERSQYTTEAQLRANPQAIWDMLDSPSIVRPWAEEVPMMGSRRRGR